MKLSILSITRNMAGAMLISFLATGAIAQALEKSLEDVGVITSVSAATSTFALGTRNLRVTTATRVTSEDPALSNSRMSDQWLGQQIGMETHEAPDGTVTVDRIHIFSAAQ